MVFPHPPLVLIVDDYEDALEMYRDYLIFKGFRVTTASSGADAVTVALMEKPDVIFMDIRMAGLNGTDAMLTLRSDPDFHKVPIIALTAHALYGERDAALAAGFDAVIPKPCLPDDLVAIVKRVTTGESPFV